MTLRRERGRKERRCFSSRQTWPAVLHQENLLSARKGLSITHLELGEELVLEELASGGRRRSHLTATCTSRFMSKTYPLYLPQKSSTGLIDQQVRDEL